MKFHPFAPRRALAVWLLLLVVGCVASCRAQTPNAALDGGVWYEPYNQTVRLSYTAAKAEGARFDGPPAAIALTITDAGGKTLLAKRASGGANGELQWKQPLPDGKYTAAVEVAPADGKGALRFSRLVTVCKYAFEHNTIGNERVVIPPFEKITATGRNATVWGRKIRFAANGLPESINVLGQEILAPGGVRLLLRRGGADEEMKPAVPFAAATKDGYDATGATRGTLGPLQYQLNGRLEYDGTYFVTVSVDSGQKAVPVQSLTLLLPLTNTVDTFSFQKNDTDIGSSYGLSRFSGIRPDEQGVIFDARRLPSQSAYGLPCENSFVPAIYAGTGTRGLWYYAESDWDWYLNPKNEHATLERVNGRVQLRVLMVNDATTWKGRRTFTFALMPQPVKPMTSGWRKVAWSYPTDQYVHDGSGWRYYGDGVNAFTLPTDEDYRQLGRVLAGEAPMPPKIYGQSTRKKRDDPRPHVLYGSSLMAGTGVAQGEWATYGQEWIHGEWGRMPFDPNVKPKFKGRQSYGGFTWEDDLSFKPASVQWTDSWVDFALYYHQKLVTLAGVNGTWFDNQSTFTIPDYDENGLNRHLIENPQRFPSGVPLADRAFNYGRRYHIFQFRTYLKRLATMCHTAGVQPFWLVNQHPTRSFGQMAWHIEADYYAFGNVRDLVEKMGVPGFRARVRTQGGIIPRLHTHVDLNTQPPVEGRSDRYEVKLTDATALQMPDFNRTHMGMCLLHDIGMVSGRDELLLKKLDEQFGFFDEGIQFLPYWSQKSAAADSNRIYVSLFANRARKRAIAVVFNDKKDVRGLTVPLSIEPEVWGLSLQSAQDVETGEPIIDLQTAQPGLQARLYVPPRSFRILLLQ